MKIKELVGFWVPRPARTAALWWVFSKAIFTESAQKLGRNMGMGQYLLMPFLVG
jgi:hypothetical protein